MCRVGSSRKGGRLSACPWVQRERGTDLKIVVCLQVYAAGSEDMDTLTFNSPLLLRHLTFSEAKKAPISEINLKVVLEELDMTMERVRLANLYSERVCS